MSNRFPVVQRQISGTTITEAAPCRSIQGLEYFDIIEIDQSPVGRTQCSSPAT